MEVLTIFILFVVFSIIKAVAESEKKAAERRSRQPGGVPRQRKVRAEKTPLEVDWEKIYAEAEKLHARESIEANAGTTVGTPTVKPSQLSKQVEKKTTQKKPSPLFPQNDLVRGIVMAEILGRPRAYTRKQSWRWR